MIVNFNVEVECDEKHCYINKKACFLLSFARFGTIPICKLFGILYEDENLRVLRHDDCLKYADKTIKRVDKDIEV